jgi:putative membrane protein
MQFAIILLKGAVIGVANIIPGVSGGTMALVLGIYERLIRAIQGISLRTIKVCLGLLKFNRSAWTAFLEEMQRIDAVFIGALGAGAMAAIVALANLMTYLLEKQHDLTYGFFFGLVVASAWVPFKLIKKQTLVGLLAGVIALTGVVVLTNTMSGDAIVNKEIKKVELKMEKTVVTVDSASKDRNNHHPSHLMFMFAAGAVAISAMILPGISGSFILLLLGAYFELIKAITYRDFPILVVFGLGCGVGIILFTRILNFVLHKWHDITMTFLLGLMLGSLWAIWPFKSSVLVGKETLYLANRIPITWTANEMLTILTCLLGGMIEGGFIWIEIKREKIEK